MIKQVLAESVPEPANGIFSNCLVVDGTIYLSGQHAGSSDGSVAGGESMAEQTREAFRKIQGLVEAAGGRMADVVKLTFYVTDIARRAEASAVRREFFAGILPCSTLLGIAALSAPGLLVEIDAIAVIGASR